MNTAGIIAEYNPFHNGHVYLIQKAREAGADCIVAVMSGNFVQRGEPALFSHPIRTRAALMNGADLVLQLPVIYALSGAQSFAGAGVSVLEALGCVDSLVFGSECGSTEKITEAAIALSGEEIKPLISEELSKGISFASARENALRRISPESADIIRTPNNILGVEYVSAIRRIGGGMKAVTFAREGAEHDSAKACGYSASASKIRENFRNGEEWRKYVPENAAELYSGAETADISGIERAILYRLRTADAREISQAPDVSEGIENRIASAAVQATSLEELYSLAKTKRYSHARIRRIVLNFFLGITAKELEIPVPYIRVTGFTERGAGLIRAARETARLPIITKAADIRLLGEEAQTVFSAECRAGDIYSLCLPGVRPCGDEKSFRPIIL